MKKTFSLLMLLLFYLNLSVTIAATSPPEITHSVSGKTASVTWSPIEGATGYTLYYAPMPYVGEESIGAIEVGNATNYSQELPTGAAYYVAVKSYDENGYSAYSNIISFTISSETENSGTRGLERASSPAALAAYLKQGFTQQTALSGPYRNMFIEFDVAEGSIPPAAVNDNGPAFSTTNLQVDGVDEADRIKSDGTILYAIKQDESYSVEERMERSIMVMNLETAAANTSQTESIMLPDALPLQGLYLVNDFEAIDEELLISFGTTQDNYSYYAVDWFVPWSWQQRQTEISLINVADPQSPRIVKTYLFDGQLVSSRRIGAMVYLVLRYNPALDEIIAYPQTEQDRLWNENRIETAELEELLPHYWINDVDLGPITSPDRCYLPDIAPDSQTADLITVIGLDLTNLEQEPSAVTLASPTEAIYMSNAALYLATTRYFYQPVASTEQLVVYDSAMTTDLHKFALSADGPSYQGSGSVAGHLGWEQDKKSFRMGEVDGALGIVTSVGESWSGTETTRLTFLSESSESGGNLTPLAQLPNTEHPESIGKTGERLYAARFMGERLYLVTFRVTDPLYIVNIADPGAPFIEGSLEIEGYSDYLHPIGENLLLGIGKDAVSDLNAPSLERGAWYQGLKLSLFDVSDAAAPHEVDSIIIGKRGTHSELLVDHHAIAYLQETPWQARFALPIELHDQIGTYTDTSQPWTYYDWTHTALYLFEVDASSGAGSARIRSAGNLIAESGGPLNFGGYTTGDRALIVENRVYYLHKNELWSALWPEP